MGKINRVIVATKVLLARTGNSILGSGKVYLKSNIDATMHGICTTGQARKSASLSGLRQGGTDRAAIDVMPPYA